MLIKIDSLEYERFTDEQKIKELQYHVTDLLWSNDDARLIGFRAWIKMKIKETRNMMEYYRRNENENRKIDEEE